MSYRKIFLTEQKLREDIQKRKEKLVIMDQLRAYMMRLDHKAEVIPEGSETDLLKLLEDLKGAPLTEDESIMVSEIMNQKH